jgi:tetratricopeptide (TPR) repeat protein
LDPRSFLSKNALGKAHARLAETLETLGREAEAAPEWDLAVELGTEETLQPHRALRALNRARQGRFDEALAELEEVTRAEPEDPVHSFNFARALALAAADSDDDDRRDDLASRAVEQLRFAVDAGFADADRLDQEPDLDVLRGRDDFDRLRPASTPGPPG